MMAAIMLWFVMANGTGYLEPLTVLPAAMRCGLEGEVVGVLVDRPVNPTVARWPDPGIAGKHCEVDIAQKVASLAGGEYHLATTIIGKVATFGPGAERYIGHDPHTSTQWRRSLEAPGLPPRPANFRIGGMQ